MRCQKINQCAHIVKTSSKSVRKNVKTSSKYVFNNNSNTFKNLVQNLELDRDWPISVQNENKNQKKNGILVQKCAVETENSKTRTARSFSHR